MKASTQYGEHSQETKIAILEAKVDHMMGVVRVTLRVRANEGD